MISWEECFFIFLILFISSLTQGLLGFGFGIVAMTLLPLTLGLRDAVTLLALLLPVLMMLSLYWQKRVFNWRDSKLIMLGSLVGIPLGALVVGALPDRMLYGILGAAMTIIGAGHFLPSRKISPTAFRRWEIPVGILSGILAAGFNMGGPPVVAYVYSRDWTGDQAKAMLAAVFLFTSITRLSCIGLTGVNLPMVLQLAAILVIPASLSLILGITLGRKIPHDFLRPVVFAYLGITGLYYLFLH